MPYTLTELQELAREYNAAHVPIPIKQPKLALHAQLEQRGAFAEAEGQDTAANLVEAMAREATIWALKGEDRRRFQVQWRRREEKERKKKKKKRERSATNESAAADGEHCA